MNLPPIREFTEAEKAFISSEIRKSLQEQIGVPATDLSAYVQDHLVAVETMVLETLQPILGRLPEIGKPGKVNDVFLNDAIMANFLATGILMSARESMTAGMPGWKDV